MEHDHAIRLDLNNPVLQDALFALQKAERLAALDALQKLRRLTWTQLYADKGLRWEKISSITPPKGIPALYSMRITRSCRATAFRDGPFLRFLTLYSDHDAAYGKK
jgi:hypothetical protein